MGIYRPKNRHIPMPIFRYAHFFARSSGATPNSRKRETSKFINIFFFLLFSFLDVLSFPLLPNFVSASLVCFWSQFLPEYLQAKLKRQKLPCVCGSHVAGKKMGIPKNRHSPIPGTMVVYAYFQAGNFVFGVPKEHAQAEISLRRPEGSPFFLTSLGGKEVAKLYEPAEVAMEHPRSYTKRPFPSFSPNEVRKKGDPSGPENREQNTSVLDFPGLRNQRS